MLQRTLTHGGCPHDERAIRDCFCNGSKYPGARQNG